jgi:hypothetical protein
MCSNGVYLYKYTTNTFLLRGLIRNRYHQHCPIFKKKKYSYYVNNSLEKNISKINQSTEGAEFVWVSECQKGEGCEIINQFVFV